MMSEFLQTYRAHVAERAVIGIPPLPLSAKQTGEVIELLKNPPKGEEAFLVELITHRVPAGVDDAAKVKASYLAAVAHGTEKCSLISREKATQLLGTMLGGYNISPMVELLDDAEDSVATQAANGLKHTLLMFDQFHDVQEKAGKGNKSMLMNQKLGIRLADECVSPTQQAFAEQMKLNPIASVLDKPAAAASAPAAAQAPAAAASASK